MKKSICCLLLTFALFSVGCIRRTTIPDDELALIFRDAFLANSYIYEKRVDFDTLQVYQPIFDKYGYSSEDVSYTVGSFSKRKSARLSDVVESAIKMLEQGELHYRNETVILDSIEAISLRRATRTIYFDDEVKYHALRDTSSLRIELDSIPAGTYRVSYDYLVDSLDTNRSSYRTMSWVENTAEEEQEASKKSPRRGLVTSYLRKRAIEDYERELVYDTMVHRLVIQLAESYEVKRKPHVTFRNVKVDYTPPAAEAIDEFYNSNLDIQIFANDFFKLQPTDSLELSSL
ncbi:MAG: DUF4296 domain-containing protein [Rikenellaceae bacterium]